MPQKANNANFFFKIDTIMTKVDEILESLPEFVRKDVAKYRAEAQKYNHYDVQLLYTGFSVNIGPKGVVTVERSIVSEYDDADEEEDVIVVSE